MQEIEVKILDVNRQAVEKKLQELGAKLSFQGELHAMFFDDKDQSIKNKGQLLRIRKEGEQIVLTHKSPISGGAAKIMEEIETTVSDLETTARILKALGYEAYRETRKIRTEYLLEGSHIVIDEYLDALSYIPVFIEVEAPDMEALQKTVSLLGYQSTDCKDWNTFDLMIHYAQHADPELQ